MRQTDDVLFALMSAKKSQGAKTTSNRDMASLWLFPHEFPMYKGSGTQFVSPWLAPTHFDSSMLNQIKERFQTHAKAV